MKMLTISEIKDLINHSYPEPINLKKINIIWADINNDQQLELIVSIKDEKEHLLIFDNENNEYVLKYFVAHKLIGPISIKNNIIFIKPLVGSGPNWQMSEIQMIVNHQGNYHLAWSGIAEEHTRFKCDSSSTYGSIFFDDNRILHHIINNHIYDCENHLTDTITTVKNYNWDSINYKYTLTEKPIEYFEKNI